MKVRIKGTRTSERRTRRKMSPEERIVQAILGLGGIPRIDTPKYTRSSNPEELVDLGRWKSSLNLS
jgi:hypothetical protein